MLWRISENGFLKCQYLVFSINLFGLRLGKINYLTCMSTKPVDVILKDVFILNYKIYFVLCTFIIFQNNVHLSSDLVYVHVGISIPMLSCISW